MDTLDYECAVVRKGEEITFSQKQIESFAQENNKEKALKISQLDPKDLKCRKKQTGFINKTAETMAA